VCFNRINGLLVGTPIDAPSAKDDDQAVKRLHDQYMNGLQALWDKYKDELAPNRMKELAFI
jgi:2-acylglycerol O-acyltransferase 2